MDPISEQDKNVLKQAVELLWAQGVKHPNAAIVGVQFTQLVERLCKQEKPKEVADGGK